MELLNLPQRMSMTKSKGRVNGRQELQEDIV
jgi:hypothetical protein